MRAGDGPSRARYLRALQRRDRAMRTAAACFDGYWLGRLGDRTLDEVDEHFFANTREELDGQGVPYTSEEWNAQGLFPWERAVVGASFAPGCRVAVTGAGGGREVRGLLQLGFDAHGFEPNERLVAEGERLLAAAGFPRRLDVRGRHEPPLPEGWDADAVVVGWGSYMLIAGSAARTAFLEQLARHLPQDAPVLLSFWSRDMLVHGRARLSATVANALRRLHGRPPVEVGDTLHPNRLHTFTEAEVRAEVSAAGMRLSSLEWSPFPHAVARTPMRTPPGG